VGGPGSTEFKLYIYQLLLTIINSAICIYGFCVVLTVNWDYFLKQH
jgi:hypothetical protein